MHVAPEIQECAVVAGRRGHGQGELSGRHAQFPVLATPAKRPSLPYQHPDQGIDFLAGAVFHGAAPALKPFTALVDETPFAVLPDGCLTALKFFGVFKARCDHPFLPLIDETPAASLGLHRRQAFAEGADIAVFGAGRSAGGQTE